MIYLKLSLNTFISILKKFLKIKISCKLISFCQNPPIYLYLDISGIKKDY